MANALSIISTVSFVIAGVSFLLALFFWFKFKIPTVIGDLSGRTARKSIAQLRANNEKSGNKSYRPSATNVERGKLTETMQQPRKTKAQPKQEKPVQKSKKAQKKVAQPSADSRPETGLLSSNVVDHTVESEATSLLVGHDETEMLDQTVTTPTPRVGGKKLTMLDEVMLIHTDEEI